MSYCPKCGDAHVEGECPYGYGVAVAPEEREAPRCATCGDEGRVPSGPGGMDIARYWKPCPTCAPPSETDGGLIGDLQMAESVLLTEALHDGGDRAAVLEAQAARIGRLREHLEACLASGFSFESEEALMVFLGEAVR